VCWFLLMYTASPINTKYVRRFLLTHIYCNQLEVFSRLMRKLIGRCVVTRVSDKFSIDATGAILDNVWS